MTRPLRSPPITGGSPLLRAGPPADATTVLSTFRFSPVDALPLTATRKLPRASAKSSYEPEGGQRQEGRSGVLSQAGGDVRVAGQAQGVDRQGAQAGEVGRAGAGANLAVVLAEGHVADPVQAALDAPVPAHPAGQQRRIGGAGIEAGDGVDGLHAPAPAPGAPPADDFQGLSASGKNSPCPSLLPA